MDWDSHLHNCYLSYWVRQLSIVCGKTSYEVLAACTQLCVSAPREQQMLVII